MKNLLFIITLLLFSSCVRREYAEMKPLRGTQDEINSILDTSDYKYYNNKYYLPIVTQHGDVYYISDGIVYIKKVEDYPHPAIVVVITLFIGMIMLVISGIIN